MKKSRILLALLALSTLFLVSCSNFADALSSFLSKNSATSEASASLEGGEATQSNGKGEQENSQSDDEGEKESVQNSSVTSAEQGGDRYLYNDFTSAEKRIFRETVGEVIPFMPNDGYSVDSYELEDEIGVCFIVEDGSREEFDAYRGKFTSYTLVDVYYDDSDGAWYAYEKRDLFVDVTFVDEGIESYVEVYAYVLLDDSGGDLGGGSGGGSETDGDVITNDGKGLPKGENGVYGVDFTAATYVKNVTEQGYYLGGCPTVGNPAVLVIPVEFSDVTANSKGYDTAVIKEAFERGGQTDYHSVYDYYYTSSYGQLSLDITVLDFWFRPKNKSTYYQNATQDYYGDEIAIGDQIIMDEALSQLSKTMDLSSFDSDGNGMIDAVVLINTLDIGEDDFHWAYRYWNLYVDSNDEYYEYDGVSANDYLWASYQFLYDDNEGGFDDVNAVNTYTYIHEFGHILGADDYYDTAGKNEPMGGCDIMDSMIGDHNAFTKFNYGWLRDSRLVTTNTSVTLRLDDFSKAGDTIILANDWDPALGAYQEYYIVAYYRSVGLNAGAGGYFSREGIVVYHVNASLYKEEVDGEIYYDVKYNNTDASDEYGTKNDLIEYVLSRQGKYTYAVGDTLPTVTTDGGKKLGYTFTVDALHSDYATITFTKE